MATYATCAAWIEALRKEPDVRLDRMLRQWDTVSPYQRGEPSDTIRIALSEHGSDDDRRLIDRALAAWLAARLAEPPKAVLDLGWNAYVSALMDAFGLAASLTLPETGALLRDRHLEFKGWTKGLSEEGPGNVQARYLLALAHHQGATRRFLPLWQTLCQNAGADQPTPEEADFFLTIGLLGLQLLPSPDGGATVAEEADGLLRWAAKLSDTPHNRTRFLRRWRVFAGAHPRTPDRWAGMLADQLTDRAKRPFAAWLREELGVEAQAKGGTVREPSKADTDRLLGEIRKLSWPAARTKIEGFMAWQERYASATMSLAHLPMAFNRVGNALLRTEEHPDALPLAERLAQTALEYDANDEPSWVLWFKTLRRQSRTHRAEALLWRACQRMPENVYFRTVLAEAMAEDGRAAEAEALYRDTIKRFPDDDVAPTALAKLLADNERIKEAETLYRDTIKRFPDNDVAPNALAKLLADNGRTKEAEALYRDTIERLPENPVCRLDLGLLLIDQGRPLEEVQALLDDLDRLRASEARTLRHHMDAARQGRRLPRSSAERRVQEVPPLQSAPERDPDWAAFIASGDALHAEFLLSPAVNDNGLVLMTPKVRADLRETAKSMLRAAVERAPNNPVVRLIAARHPEVVARSINADDARRVAGGDFGLRLELALRDEDEEALGYLFEDFRDHGQQAVVACAWLWLNADADAPGAEDAAEHLRQWLSAGAPKTGLPALVYIHDELRERLPHWSRNVDLDGFLESWATLRRSKEQREQIRALIDIAVLGLVLAEVPLLVDLPLAA